MGNCFRRPYVVNDDARNQAEVLVNAYHDLPVTSEHRKRRGSFAVETTSPKLKKIRTNDMIHALDTIKNEEPSSK